MPTAIEQTVSQTPLCVLRPIPAQNTRRDAAGASQGILCAVRPMPALNPRRQPPRGVPSHPDRLIGPHQLIPPLRNAAGATLGILCAIPPIPAPPRPLIHRDATGGVTGHPVRHPAYPSAPPPPYTETLRGGVTEHPARLIRPHQPNPPLRNAAGAALGILRAPTPCTGPDASPVGTPTATAPRRRRG